jgi:type II secretory ATPase GspE/PulE/Tfp pilus assembly ATPase PilB-like protein
MVQFDEAKQKKKLDELRKHEEEQLMQILSEKYNIPYLDPVSISVSNDAIALVSEDYARDRGIGIFKKTGKNIIDVALVSPNSEKVLSALHELEERGFKINLHLVSHAGLEKIWGYYKDISLAQKTEAGIFDISHAGVEELADKLHSSEDVEKLIADITTKKGLHQVSKIFEVVLAGAIAIGASDIHLEPQEDAVRLRYRLDGILQDISLIDHHVYRLLLSRLKLLSGLKLNISGDTQDGRFSIKLKGIDIEIRTSILPGSYGEGSVLRILNPESISVPLESLGMEEDLLKVINREINKPNGMILTTGPTGSGKTTSLYAFLRKIYTPEIKIITIEDPVEYHLKGITQTQVDPESNYTFLSGLRAALRQDPDVIMVGEIRDGETAKIAINSALTGHLVLSTLHTNNAAGVIPRLIDLGVNPKVISSALTLSIAQRLIRKLCEQCKKEDAPNEREKKILLKILESVKQKKKQDYPLTNIWRAVGCDKCNHTGYKGRLGVYEAILMDAAVEKILTQNPNERDIIEASKGQGMLDMREDGAVKIVRGITSMDEVERVVDMEKDLF